jgi:hypothetical protein
MWDEASRNGGYCIARHIRVTKHGRFKVLYVARIRKT